MYPLIDSLLKIPLFISIMLNDYTQQQPPTKHSSIMSIQKYKTTIRTKSTVTFTIVA